MYTVLVLRLECNLREGKPHNTQKSEEREREREGTQNSRKSIHSVGAGFLGKVDIAFLVVNFLRLFVAHEKDGGAKQENCSTPSNSVSL
jgi:hypothetical protein